MNGGTIGTRNTVTNQKNNTAGKRQLNVRYMTMTAMLSAVAVVLMFLDFSVPLMPTFIKFDLSELPALVGAFAMGPASGTVICLIKNLLHLTMTTTGGVGELSNFILGAAFILPAGIMYQRKKNRNSALAGSLLGAFLMAIISVFSNYFFVYPIYYNIMPQETIINAYRTAAQILPLEIGWDTMLPYLIAFNMPFTLLKGLVNVLITFLIYKHISPIIKGVGSHNSPAKS